MQRRAHQSPFVLTLLWSRAKLNLEQEWILTLRAVDIKC